MTFLVFRFALLALVVPFAEEAFLRGWLVRFVEDPEWQNVRLSQIGWRGLVTATVYGILTHPSEALAAACWFTLISVLMRRTGKFWNCVLAHAVTNLLLGVYVMIWHQWQLW